MNSFWRKKESHPGLVAGFVGAEFWSKVELKDLWEAGYVSSRLLHWYSDFSAFLLLLSPANDVPE